MAALNAATLIYSEHLNDDDTAYQRSARAVQLAPDNLSALANYAEILLASGRDEQAREAAARAREHAEVKPYQKAAMSFVLFGAEFFSGNHGQAAVQLEQIAHNVQAAAAKAKEAAAKGKKPDKWLYGGIRRSLERRLAARPPEQRSALLTVLTFVETNGQEGTLDQMRRLLGSQPARE